MHARSTDKKAARSVVQSLNHPSSTISQYLSSTSRCRSYRCTNKPPRFKIRCSQSALLGSFQIFCVLNLIRARECVAHQDGQTRFSSFDCFKFVAEESGQGGHNCALDCPIKYALPGSGRLPYVVCARFAWRCANSCCLPVLLFSKECSYRNLHVFKSSSRNDCNSRSVAVGGARPYLRSASVWLSASTLISSTLHCTFCPACGIAMTMTISVSHLAWRAARAYPR